MFNIPKRPEIRVQIESYRNGRPPAVNIRTNPLIPLQPIKHRQRRNLAKTLLNFQFDFSSINKWFCLHMPSINITNAKIELKAEIE
jgi:hypothetical protein